MDFTEPQDARAIREAVRALCARFPGEYWRGLEPDRYPTEFVERADRGGLAGGADPRASTAARGWRSAPPA